MPPVSYQKQIVNVLKKPEHKYNKATYAQLLEGLGPKWTPEMLSREINKLDANPSASVAKVHGGVQYFGVETGLRPGLYKEIRQGIEKRWASENKLGLHVEAVHTSHQGTKGAGTWSHPDLVVRVQRRADAQPLVEYHAIEIEQSRGFDIKSVYQAFEQGRGADYRWVFFTGATPNDDDKPWRRIRAAAHEVGVGLVHVPKPTAPSGWKTFDKARIVTTRPTEAQRKEFFTSCKIDQR